MRKWLYLVFVLILMMMVAACGGDDDDNGSSANNDDGGGNTSSDGTFTFTVSGADSRTVSDENGTIFYTVLEPVEVEGVDTLDMAVKNELFMYEGSFGADLYQVTINIPPNATPGTYPFAGEMGMFEDDAVTGSYGTVEMGDSDNIADAETRDYTQNIDGSLTISAIEDGRISGSFEFSADYVDFDDAGQAITETVTVNGEFADVPLREG